jgi:RNA polymerase sigma-70 factor (ECF subfamily)
MDSEVAEAALRRLAEGHREVVVLRIWGELGWAQIAQIMQLSVSTVFERYRVALAELRIAMEKPCEKNNATAD